MCQPLNFMHISILILNNNILLTYYDRSIVSVIFHMRRMRYEAIKRTYQVL